MADKIRSSSGRGVANTLGCCYRGRAIAVEVADGLVGCFTRVDPRATETGIAVACQSPSLWTETVGDGDAMLNSRERLLLGLSIGGQDSKE